MIEIRIQTPHIINTVHSTILIQVSNLNSMYIFTLQDSTPLCLCFLTVNRTCGSIYDNAICDWNDAFDLIWPGLEDTRVWQCSCTGDLCNSSQPISSTYLLVLALATVTGMELPYYGIMSKVVSGPYCHTARILSRTLKP